LAALVAFQKSRALVVASGNIPLALAEFLQAHQDTSQMEAAAAAAEGLIQRRHQIRLMHQTVEAQHPAAALALAAQWLIIFLLAPLS
jgi:hypothetical protein